MDSLFARFGWLAFGLCFAAGLTWSLIFHEPLLGPPGSMGDDVYFENIGWQLSKGRGISFDFTDKEWRLPFEEENFKGENDWILNLRAAGPTTSRSPGLPLLIAAVYSVFGRDFLVVRLVVLTMMAAACAWLVQRVARQFGWLAASLGLVTLLLDGFVWRTAGQFMSEGPALGITVALCGWVWLLSSRGEQKSWSTRLGWLGAGVLFAVGILVRANMNVWLLMIVIGLAILLGIRFVLRRDWQTLFVAALLFGIGVAAIAFPWWIRNCQVTGGFAPSGTSGSFGLVGGYCDAAFADFGNWSIEASVESQERTLARPGVRGLPLAQQEYQMGLESTAAAEEWARANWKKLPQLVGMKMLSHLGFYRQPLLLQIVNGLILFGAVLGCWSTRRSLGVWIGLVVVLSLVTTGLTWPHYGRYSIPFRPLLHLACGIGTVYFWTGLLGWLRR
jgi:hypothetical protein